MCLINSLSSIPMCLCIYLPIHLLTYYIDTGMYVCAGAQSPLMTLVTCAVSREGVRLRGVQEPGPALMPQSESRMGTLPTLSSASVEQSDKDGGLKQ